jgi:hypothetical protein
LIGIINADTVIAVRNVNKKYFFTVILSLST